MRVVPRDVGKSLDDVTDLEANGFLPPGTSLALAGVVKTRLDELWDATEAAFQLPDDGIDDWSLTLWHDPSGWHAEAQRSDTTDTRSTGYPSARAALAALALATPGETVQPQLGEEAHDA